MYTTRKPLCLTRLTFSQPQSCRHEISNSQQALINAKLWVLLFCRIVINSGTKSNFSLNLEGGGVDLVWYSQIISIVFVLILDLLALKIDEMLLLICQCILILNRIYYELAMSNQAKKYLFYYNPVPQIKIFVLNFEMQSRLLPDLK